VFDVFNTYTLKNAEIDSVRGSFRLGMFGISSVKRVYRQATILRKIDFFHVGNTLYK
jgi:hypothetical protein